MPWLKWVLVLLLVSGSQYLKGEEGMWIPMLIEKYHINDMQEAGLKLNAEDIYSINQDCLKDAIVIFGGGCTGEMISGEGLVLTNHHCGESAIQSHSSVEHDYLTKGFWAMSRDEELPNSGLSVTYLRYMKDVTEEVNDGLVQGMDPLERQQMIDRNSGEIVREATNGTHFVAQLRPFYYGNAYYLFVYEKFRDVRLVGAPPSSVGNFGADYDNWMWPRHTGDFSLFRVYADADNQPADYSPDNKPYMPRKHLEVNLGGIQEGDFSMILGYPASTAQYLYSEAVRSMVETSLPLKVGLRFTRLEIMDKHMLSSDVVRIQYSHKFRRVSNAWKKWKGMILGLNRNHTVELKKEEETSFQQWVDQDEKRVMKYGELMGDFNELYTELAKYTIGVDMFNESVMAVELFRQSLDIRSQMIQGAGTEQMESFLDRFFKDFHQAVDVDIFAAMMEAYEKEMPVEYHPAFFGRVNKEFKGDFHAFAKKLYSKSVFSNRELSAKLVETWAGDHLKGLALVEKDPITVCLDQIREIYSINITDEHRRTEWEEKQLYKSYMAALIEMSEEYTLYPDANRTMRITYGTVKGYQPKDGVEYQSSTTLEGLMEKCKQGRADYVVPEKLVSLYETKDFGPYGVNETLPVCFIASNHTSGGNSGSPVLDAEGRLIGLNFDRDWEGTMSDVFYDPDLCRNIAVDIRYVLFIIDKYAGAGYLINEMDVVVPE
ncbi:MAG: S46 family peptidase [Bacteroidetes bacterium]|nr:S46 family peptidase [Bacteroidota bacterium]